MATRTQEAFWGWLEAIRLLMVYGHYKVAREQLEQLRMKAWDSDLGENFWEDVARKFEVIELRGNPAKKRSGKKKKNPSKVSVRRLVNKALK